ncbi:MAG: hypothetical protein GY820_11245 [Gammaproteobacteria bacterium]|nr:hypothetical protein [Gammaproteobacteria bacterium]
MIGEAARSSQSSRPKDHKLTVVGHLSDGEDKIGHAFAILTDNNGNVVTRGYWPADTSVGKGKYFFGTDGVVLDEITTGYYDAYLNDSGLNASKTFSITASQYNAAMGHINQVSANPGTYSLVTNMCGSFASDVARAAGQSTGVFFSSPRSLYEQFGGQLP